jgi:hypothetical protein
MPQQPPDSPGAGKIRPRGNATGDSKESRAASSCPRGRGFLLEPNHITRFTQSVPARSSSESVRSAPLSHS